MLKLFQYEGKETCLSKKEVKINFQPENFPENGKSKNVTNRMENDLFPRERCQFPRQDGKETFFAMRKMPIYPAGWTRNFLCHEKGANFPDRMEKKLSLSRERCLFPQQDGEETFFVLRKVPMSPNRMLYI
jgi:hypothetical protein